MAQKTPFRHQEAPNFDETNPAIKIPETKQLCYLFIFSKIYRSVVDRFKYINDCF